MTIEYDGEIDIEARCSKCNNNIDIQDAKSKRNVTTINVEFCSCCESELESKIEELENENEELKAEIESLKAIETFTKIIQQKINDNGTI